jgi:hypothetical protein
MTIFRCSLPAWVKWVDRTRLLGKILVIKVKEKRPMGLPRTRWYSHIWEDIKKRGRTGTWLSVTRGEVWIGNRIYWTLMLWQSHWVTHPKDHCNYSTHKVLSVFSSRAPSSWFLKCLWPQLPASHFSQLQQTTSLCYIAPAWTAQKTSLPLMRILSLLGKQHVHRAVP